MSKIFYRKDIIDAIATEQSFSKAAQKLFVAQPSLSLMVKTLEEDLGTPLFDRSSKPIQLTDAGREYIHATKQIQAIEHAYLEYIQSLDNVESGALRIGSNQLLSSLVLPKYISKFVHTYPKIQLSLIDANSTSLENQISSGALDIVIDNSVLPTETFEQVYLASEQLLLAVPSEYPENELYREHQLTYMDILQGRHLSSAIEPVPLDGFSHTPFILMNRDNDVRKQTAAIFQEMRFTPKVLFEMDRLTTLYSYVEQCTAASIVSDTLVRNIKGVRQDHITFYNLPTSHNRRNIYAYYKRNKFCTRAMSALIGSLEGLL